MKKLKFFIVCVVIFIALKILFALFGKSIIGSAIAKSKPTPTLEQEISTLVSAVNKAYTFPVKMGEVTYLLSIAYKGKEVLFAYLFTFDFNSLSLTEKKEIQKSANKDIHNYHRVQCQNKMLYENLLAKGALFHYEFYSADQVLIQSKILTASDCHK